MSLHPCTTPNSKRNLRDQCPNLRRLRFSIPLILVLLIKPGFAADQPKEMTPGERNYVEAMLALLSDDVIHHYYDPTLHGVDWQAKVAHAREQIKQEKSLNMAMSHVAATLDSLNDSHTFLIPPPRPYILDHGWNIEMVGKDCYVTGVRPGGDAEKHGVKPGDQVVAINGFRITRDNLWRIQYAFDALRPQPQLTITLRNPQGELRKTLLEATFIKRPHLENPEFSTTSQDWILDAEAWEKRQHIRTAEFGSDLLIAKLPSFMFDEGEAGKLISMARKHNALILDLRQNGGGAIDILRVVVGGLFDHDVKICERVGREVHKPMVAKSNHHNFEGKLYVLIDSQSASASELLARIVQLEKRGTVIGDVSSGSVMQAKPYIHQAGVEIVTYFGASITDANLIMSDEKSLEHSGVTPDEIMLPSAADLADGKDPVLAHVASLAQVKLTPEQAGKLFPYEWPSYRSD